MEEHLGELLANCCCEALSPPHGTELRAYAPHSFCQSSATYTRQCLSALSPASPYPDTLETLTWVEWVHGLPSAWESKHMATLTIKFGCSDTEGVWGRCTGAKPEGKVREEVWLFSLYPPDRPHNYLKKKKTTKRLHPYLQPIKVKLCLA